MRLLFLNYEFPPVGGGAAYASFAMARELASMGHQVHVLTAATPGLERDEEIDGVRIFRVRCYRRSVHDIGLFGAISFILFATPRLRVLAKQNQYDAYHYYFGLPTGLLTRFPGDHRSRPYVISLRGSDVPGYNRQVSVLHRLMLPISRRIWSGAHRVIANSNELRKLAHAAMPDLRIDVILNGAAKPARPDTPPAAHAGVRVLTVCRLIGRKGVDTLIKALATSKDSRLSVDIAGDGPDAAALRQLAQSCGVADRVRFHGFADRAALAALYAHADVFVLMSRVESCSMALLEAMAAGLPIIASKVGGNIELVRHRVDGLLIEPDNVDELASALVQLADDPHRRARLSAASRLVAELKYGWRAVAREYEAVLEQAVSNASAARALTCGSRAHQ
ncbi:MAG TPA: glycosyltransferase family 4 protein [Steroidobacteraceae bacterium]|nr:glycosyltransferase family 4 protein [Steroidobacteraceae bacterium]